MAKHIFRCKSCSSYTMQEEHCNEKTITPKPPKYSPEDKYGSYRRKVKQEELKSRGLI